MNITEARRIVTKYREAGDHDRAYMLMLDIQNALEEALPKPEDLMKVFEELKSAGSPDLYSHLVKGWQKQVEDLNLGSGDEFVVYSQGILCCSVCTSLDIWDVCSRMNAVHPSGTKNGWMISKDETFSGGEPMPCPCDTHPETHKHYLMEC